MLMRATPPATESPMMEPMPSPELALTLLEVWVGVLDGRLGVTVMMDVDKRPSGSVETLVVMTGWVSEGALEMEEALIEEELLLG
jgi:hypothetical protein